MQFRWAVLSPDTLSALPTAFLSAQLRPSDLDRFKATWAVRGVLCAVEVGAGGDGAAGPPRLQLRLSAEHPLLAPQEEL